jgi:hypothetical protein
MRATTAQLQGTKSRRILIIYFGGRFLMSVQFGPTTMNIAVSNGRSHCPALLVSTCSAWYCDGPLAAERGQRLPGFVVRAD